MQVYASTKGRFVESVTVGANVKDLVSLLQLEAHTAEETQVIRDLYMIIQRGGTIRVSYVDGGMKVDTEAIGPAKPGVGASGAEGTDMPVGLAPLIEAAVYAAAQSEPGFVNLPATPAPAVAASLPPPAPTEHVHFYNREVGVVEDGDSIWMKCSCGEWSYFDHREPKATKKKLDKKKVN